MAKTEKILKGNFDSILYMIESGVMSKSMSASLEEKSDFFGANTRCSVRVFERFSYLGGNRVSMNVTLYQKEDGLIHLSAITSGGSQATFFKMNTIGEKSFLKTIEEIFAQNQA